MLPPRSWLDQGVRLDVHCCVLSSADERGREAKASATGFSRRLRDECLNEHLFANLNEARQYIEEWRIDYNTNRPHTSLNGLTPTEFATRPNRSQTQNRLSL